MSSHHMDYAGHADGQRYDDRDSGLGPIRSSKPGDDRDKKGPIAAPVKSACTFCRSRKSRCDGNKPCRACVARGRTDVCLYTISRRGGKPKPKIDPSGEIQLHLNKLFHLTEIPYLFRRPGGLDGLSNYPTFPAEPFVQGGLKPQAPEWQQQQSQPHHHQPQMPPQHHQQQQQQQSTYPMAQTQPHILQPAPNAQLYQSAPFHATQQQAHTPQVAFPSQPLPPASDMYRRPAPASQQPWTVSGFLASLQAQAQVNASSNASAGSASASASAASSNDRNQNMFTQSTNASPSSVRTSPPESSNHSSPAVSEETKSIKRLLSDYYKYLYRFVPVLPESRYIDIVAGTMTSDSPFILALGCTLPLLKNEEQPLGALHDLSGQDINFGSEEKKQRLKEQTYMSERKAIDALDTLLEQAESDNNGEKSLELIQTLCVMVVYEYGTGKVIKSRLKADQALGLAMAQGLHKLTASNSSEARAAPSSFASFSSGLHSLVGKGVPSAAIFEVRKRCWWVVWSLVLWTAYNTGRIPTIRADDPRVRSELPISSQPQAWKSNISSLQALLLVQDRVLALSQSGQSSNAESPYVPGTRDPSQSPRAEYSPSGNRHNSPFSFGRLGTWRAESVTSKELPTTFHSLPTNASRQEILDSMQEIDEFLQDQIASLEKFDPVKPISRVPSDVGGLSHVEEEMEESLKMAAAVQLYTSSLTLHIGQAFQGASLFEKKLCFLNSINDNNDPSAQRGVCREPMPNAFFDELQDVAAVDGPHGIPARLRKLSMSGVSAQWSSSPNGNGSPSSLNQTDLYARGPFLPRLSLQRCVHASKKLLDIAKRRHGQSVNPNPFNCCSFVLISFVLLMQALAVHGGFGGDEDEEEEIANCMMLDMDIGKVALDSGPDYGEGPKPQDLLRAGLSGHAVGGDAYDGMYSDSTGSFGGSDPARLAQLRSIWTRVREARDTLMDLGKHWEAVVPMADEVNLCLETSQLLLSS